MRFRSVLVVGETPSLARSIAELLELDGISVEVEPQVDRALRRGRRDAKGIPSVLVSTSTGYASDLIQDWQDGPLRESDLILVGPRDSLLPSLGRLHVARLPLVPEEFLDLVRSCLEPGPSRNPA